MWNNKKISIVFPAFNEGSNIKNAIEEIKKVGIADEIIVVNNNSTDNTAEEVHKTDAILITEIKQGYGWAIRRGLYEAKGDYIITIEPDGTFIAKDILKLLAYVEECDVVYGTRTSRELIWREANMNWFLRYGNIFVAKLIQFLHKGPAITDVGCTMKLLKKDVIKRIQRQFNVGKSHFNAELIIIIIKNKIKAIEIPLNYKRRVGTSKITGSYLKAFKLGLVMIWTCIKYLFIDPRKNFKLEKY